MKVCCIDMLARAAHLNFATKHVGAKKSGRHHWWAFIKILKDSTPSFARSGHDRHNGHQCLQHAPCCQYQGMHQVSANLFFILVTCKTVDIVVKLFCSYILVDIIFLSRRAVCAIFLPWRMRLV
ncbi:unnamed protein product [Ixodes persulcatus]